MADQQIQKSLLTQDLQRKYEDAQETADRAQFIADDIGLQRAAALLAQAYPDGTLAVFSREWDQDEPMLIQIICQTEDDILVDKQTFLGHTDPLALFRRHAVIMAENAMAQIKSDETRYEHILVEPGSELHAGWIEFDLDLKTMRGAIEAYDRIAVSN